jgi:hypothetical protein
MPFPESGGRVMKLRQSRPSVPSRHSSQRRVPSLPPNFNGSTTLHSCHGIVTPCVGGSLFLSTSFCYLYNSATLFPSHSPAPSTMPTDIRRFFGGGGDALASSPPKPSAMKQGVSYSCIVRLRGEWRSVGEPSNRCESPLNAPALPRSLPKL